MARAFYWCLICNKPGEGQADPDGSPLRGAPSGWVFMLGVYWPAGIRLNPMVLRLCGDCYLRGLTTSTPSPVVDIIKA